MTTILLTQALLMSLAFGVVVSSPIAPHHNMCMGLQDGDLLPNPFNCSSYYVCNYGMPHLFNCSLDLLFDIDLNVCNWPKEVSCRQLIDQSIHLGHPEQNGYPAPLIFIDDPSAESITAGWAPLPPGWPHAPSVPQHVHDSTDGQPEGDWIDDGWTNGEYNDGVQPIGETGSTTTKPNTTLVEFYPGIAIKSINPTTFACLRDGFYFAPHPTSCQKYFICSNRQLHEHQCGHGIQWDYGLSQCEFIERAACFSRIQQENGSFSGNVAANHGGNSNIVMGDKDGIDGELDPGYDAPEGTIDRDDPEFDPEFDSNYTKEPSMNDTAGNEKDEEMSPEDTATPQLSEEVDGSHPVGPDNNETSIEFKPEFDVLPSLDGTLDHESSSEIDSGFNVLPSLNGTSDHESSSEIDSGFNVLPSLNGTSDHESSFEIDSGFNVLPSLNGTVDNESSGEHTATPPSNDSNSIDAVPLPEWADLSESNETSNDSFLPNCPPEEQVFFPHLFDCSKFYICVSGEPVLTNCPENLTWNQFSSECVEGKPNCDTFRPA